MMYTQSVLSVFSWTPAVSPVIRLRMRSVACAGVATVLLATCLYTGGGAAGDPAHSLHTDRASIEVVVEADRLVYRLYNQNEAVLTGSFGTNIPAVMGAPHTADPCPGEDDLCFSWGDVASLGIVRMEDTCFNISWRVSDLRRIEDCIDIGAAHWYGGAEEMVQHFPLRRDNVRSRTAFLPGDMLQNRDKFFGGVAEPVWVSSSGAGVAAAEEQPLFYSWNEGGGGGLCLSAEHAAPYPAREADLRLSYSVCAAESPRGVFEQMAGRFWRLPDTIPDQRMLSQPVWSTWAQYKTEINESVVVGFANDIINHGFNHSHLEIDDNWEVCYGDGRFDSEKFPDPARMVASLNDLGFRTSLWIHPFINVECESYSEAAYPPNMFLIRDPKSKTVTHNGTFGEDGMFGDWEGTAWLPGTTLWWQGFSAGCVDFTNEEAARWWTDRLDTLRQETGIDSFKFDAGEHNWLPSSLRLDPRYPESAWPGVFSTAYVSAVARFGGMVEVRTGRRTQHLPVFTRMLDKFSTWGYDNGLKSMVTTLLQFGITGYSFVLPDMIGGNGYNGDPSRELYIRWLQVNVFMPSMQVSYVPWLYDEEVVAHARDMTSLHARYADTIIRLARQTVEDGTPICRPVWWLDPQDATALAIDDQFLLGDEVLVAPVLEEGAVTRHVYLPSGTWRDENSEDGATHTGPVWLRDYSAPLFVLPYFVKV